MCPPLTRRFYFWLWLNHQLQFFIGNKTMPLGTGLRWTKSCLTFQIIDNFLSTQVYWRRDFPSTFETWLTGTLFYRRCVITAIQYSPIVHLSCPLKNAGTRIHSESLWNKREKVRTRLLYVRQKLWLTYKYRKKIPGAWLSSKRCKVLFSNFYFISRVKSILIWGISCAKGD